MSTEQLDLWSAEACTPKPHGATPRERLFEWGRVNSFPELEFLISIPNKWRILEAYQAAGEAKWREILDAPAWEHSDGLSMELWVESALEAIQINDALKRLETFSEKEVQW